MCTTSAYLHSNTNKYKYLYKQLYIDRRTYVKINDNRNIYTYSNIIILNLVKFMTIKIK